MLPPVETSSGAIDFDKIDSSSNLDQAEPDSDSSAECYSGPLSLYAENGRMVARDITRIFTISQEQNKDSNSSSKVDAVGNSITDTPLN